MQKDIGFGITLQLQRCSSFGLPIFFGWQSINNVSLLRDGVRILLSQGGHQIKAL